MLRRMACGIIDNHQAIDIASKASKAADACVALIDESSRRWREAEGNYRDDIRIACRFPSFERDGIASRRIRSA